MNNSNGEPDAGMASHKEDAGNAGVAGADFEMTDQSMTRTTIERKKERIACGMFCAQHR